MSKLSSMSARLAAAAIVLGCSLAATQARAGDTPASARDAQASALAAALEDYARQDFGAAYARLSTLADGENIQAARMAWLMQRNGPNLYRRDFSATAAQRHAWYQLTLAALQADPPADDDAVDMLAERLPDACIDSGAHARAVTLTLALARSLPR